MPITREFIFEEDSDTGLVGLRPTWIGNANTTTAVSHDILEHFLDTGVDPISAELMALGALLALRIETGAVSPYLSSTEHLARLVSGVWEDIERYDLPIPQARASRRLCDDYRWADDTIVAAMPKAVSHLKAELRDYSERPPVLDALDALVPTTISLLRAGYRRAWRRFEGADLYTVGHYFFKKLDEVSRRISEANILSYGDVVRISVDPCRQHISFKVNGRSSDYYGF